MQTRLEQSDTVALLSFHKFSNNTLRKHGAERLPTMLQTSVLLGSGTFGFVQTKLLGGPKKQEDVKLARLLN